MYIYIHIWVCAHMSAVLVDARRGHQIPLELKSPLAVDCLITVGAGSRMWVLCKINVCS